MSAIARYFKAKGYNVSGYDRTASELTQALENEGIAVHYEDSIDYIPKDASKTFVIYTPAIPSDLKELQYVINNSYPICKRSKALGEIARGERTLAVSGTHGKTTTSTLLAHILTESGKGCNAFLGGISKNYNTNLLIKPTSDVLVAEADEFDRSFLQLYPEIAVITAADADHLDIYEDHSHVIEAFAQFASQIQTSGALVIKNGVNVPLFNVTAKVYRYSYDTPCDFYASDIIPVEGGKFDFTINYPMGKIEHCQVGVPGWVNVENAIAASAVALLDGIAPVKLKSALSSFRGVKRRFDIRVNGKYAYIDDYAHHPEEIKAAVSSIRNIFPGRRICGIFQPHLYTRTRDFADEFASALSTLDEIILLPIYPAREEPIPGVNSEMILSKITIDDKIVVDKENLMAEIESREIDCLVTLGAGDIDRFAGKIEEYLKKDA